MTVTIELPQELEEALTAEAAQLQLPLEEYVVRLLASGRSVSAEIGSGEELVAYWRREGLIGSRPDIADAQSYARQLRERAERRLQPEG